MSHAHDHDWLEIAALVSFTLHLVHPQCTPKCVDDVWTAGSWHKTAFSILLHKPFSTFIWNVQVISKLFKARHASSGKHKGYYLHKGYGPKPQTQTACFNCCNKLIETYHYFMTLILDLSHKFLKRSLRSENCHSNTQQWCINYMHRFKGTFIRGGLTRGGAEPPPSCVGKVPQLIRSFCWSNTWGLGVGV